MVQARGRRQQRGASGPAGLRPTSAVAPAPTVPTSPQKPTHESQTPGDASSHAQLDRTRASNSGRTAPRGRPGPPHVNGRCARPGPGEPRSKRSTASAKPVVQARPAPPKHHTLGQHIHGGRRGQLIQKTPDNVSIRSETGSRPSITSSTFLTSASLPSTSPISPSGTPGCPHHAHATTKNGLLSATRPDLSLLGGQLPDQQMVDPTAGWYTSAKVISFTGDRKTATPSIPP